MKKESTFDKLVKHHPGIDGVINRKSWDYIDCSDKRTKSYLNDLWVDNATKNLSGLYKKHLGLSKVKGICNGKATIGIGAGASFNKNSHILKQIHDYDGVKDWKNRDFVLIASNHQYKPLLNMGIIPDFVILADGSDVVMDQLNKDIPTKGQSSILIAGLQCSYKVCKEWSDQDRGIIFYTPKTEGIPELFNKITKNKKDLDMIFQGGNVINTAWQLSVSFLGSTVFISVGNDLSYKLFDEVDDQRRNYYADKDYSSNLENQRDEAHKNKKWLGFKLVKNKIYSFDNLHDNYHVELDIVGTSPTLWVYKTWIESQLIANEKAKIHYFNCTEGGICGVLCSDDTDEGMKDDANWFLLDEKCSRWHTTTLEDAANQFIKAKGLLKCQKLGILDDALLAIPSALPGMAYV